MCLWNWGTAENAAASQGPPQGQDSSGSRRTRESMLSNLVSLEGKTVQAYCVEALASLGGRAGLKNQEAMKGKECSSDSLC